MSKATLRQTLLTEMKSLNRETKAQLDHALLSQLLAHPWYASAHTIATYMSMEHEFNTKPFIAQALSDGKKIAIPRSFAQGRMQFYIYDPQHLELSHFGIEEPTLDSEPVAREDIDLVHVPALAVNSTHHRIGYGAGYYDRFLANFSAHTLSTVYGFQLVHFDADAYDIPVQAVISESN
ncbi:5-formyltetrahydrofolate cyclo-ligase [Alloscardovia criceti]|uniref:5-formyltetrahydrofolate cyclo-ligase n=1 Tax=Alloscardovia criceti TaxID=356828 RepID=UPI000367332B|nr:5-formyltetrahydrofolate cyclo-ligase [Alloscardovia criceti]